MPTQEPPATAGQSHLQPLLGLIIADVNGMRLGDLQTCSHTDVSLSLYLFEVLAASTLTLPGHGVFENLLFLLEPRGQW